MMAVESKQGGTGTTVPAGGTPNPASTLTGMPAVSAAAVAAANGKNRRKRPSSLMQHATSLPSVENSLDEFIARANETLVDASTFNTESAVRAEDEKRKEHDAQRWKAAEHQMRENEAREQSLRRQLDGLQGRLAEAEARAAVAGSGGSQDGIIADLKIRLTRADDTRREHEERTAQLARELQNAKTAAAAVAAAPSDSLSYSDNDELERRARTAEAKATKALAAARAAAAGLTVSQADIAAIESGLVVPIETSKKTNWGAIFAALIVGGAIMFAVSYLVLNKKDKPKAAAGAQPTVQQPAADPPPAPAPVPSKPIVTPIEDPAPAAAAEKAPVVEEKGPVAEEKKAAVEEKAAVVEEPAPKKAEPKKATKRTAPAPKKAAAPKAAPAPKAEPKKKDSGLADPFGEPPAAAPTKKAPKAKAEKKPAGGIVDPF